LRSRPIGLADISRGRPQGYLHLIPLQELIALSREYGVESEVNLDSKNIWIEIEL